MYDTIRYLYDSTGSYLEKENFNGTRMNKTTFINILLQTAHTKNEMIISCKWNNAICGADNFTPVMTDYGMCFQFNGASRAPQLASGVGSDYGLRLGINIELYEYTLGPHNSAGLKVLVHDQNSIPRVKSLGYAVNTGMHSFIGLTVKQVNYQKPPYGKCNDVSVDQNYTEEVCRLDCMTNYFDDTCSCRMYYMPQGDVRNCTVEDTVCMDKAFKVFQNVWQDICSCPIPCVKTYHNVLLSSASFAPHVISDISKNVNISELKDRQTIARDYDQRLNTMVFSQDKKLVRLVNTSFYVLHKFMDKTSKNILKKIINALTHISNELEDYSKPMKKWLFCQDYYIRKNFMRPLKAMDERTFSHVSTNFIEYATLMHTYFDIITNTSDDSERTAIYRIAQWETRKRLKMASLAVSNMTSIRESYYNGTPIFQYICSRFTRAEGLTLIPIYSLRLSLTRTWEARNYGARWPETTNKLVQWLMKYVTLLDNVYWKRAVDNQELHTVESGFLTMSRRYYNDMYNAYEDSFQWPKKEVDDRIEAFDSSYTQIKEIISEMKFYVTSTKETRRLYLRNIKVLVNLTSILERYSNTFLVKKSSLANIILSDEMATLLTDMRLTFSIIRSRSLSISDRWTRLSNAMMTFWRKIIKDPNLTDFYVAKNITWALQDYENITIKVKAQYQELQFSTDMITELQNKDTAFFTAFESLKKQLQTYVDSLKMENDFLEKNFLYLDVFYKQLSYEEVSQQNAYDQFALASDIGGSLGLLVGASLLTVFELLDLVIYHMCIRRLWS